MALTANQKAAVQLMLYGDKTAAPPVLGLADHEAAMMNAREDVKAVLRLDAAGSQSTTLWADILAAKGRYKTAAENVVSLLT